ncbi:MAG TPA: FtsX-like permease family protein [Bacteroidetes bacterium]|nr:FtsX-like permease family protein [Bacteroidota bacterium]HEX05409.1 FtsX-like permease family protein [Bacteroidota bacterium]
MYEHLQAGNIFEIDDTTQVLITNRLLERFDIEDPDSPVGQPIILFSTQGHPDSGFAAIRDSIFALSSFDLLNLLPFRQEENADSIASSVLGRAAAVFFEGYMTRLDTVRDTLIVSGVVDVGDDWADRLRPVILPERSAKFLDPGSFSQNPLSMMSAMQSGDLFSAVMQGSDDEVDRVTLELSIEANHEALVDSLEAHGFESSDFLEFYGEFRKMVLLFTAGMSFLGFIALFIAALGIVNTMVMSILERRREIGVLKSLGAEDKDIRILFLVESATIGLVGSLLGLLVGWLGTEVVGFAMREYMNRQGISDVDLFHLGPEVILISIGFGLIVSMVAGLYPANRAAQLDPVVALREE